jgi:tetratricopeptide (TPR) repeat protein
MKSRFTMTVSAFALGAALAFPLTGLAKLPQQAAPPAQQQKMPEDEFKQYDKMVKATTLSDKMKFGQEFIKKFKKTNFRSAISSHLSNQIFDSKDPNTKIQAAQSFIAMFDQPGEADLVRPALIDGYVIAGKFDEAFTEGEKYMQAHPDEVFVSASLGFNGAMQLQKQGAQWKWAKASVDNLSKAVELLEQDKKPEKTEKEFWNSYRNAWLPKLYQAQGAIFYATKDMVKAKESLEKAFGFDPYDVFTLNYLVGLTLDEYQALAQRYQTEKKTELYDKALAKMDESIDYLARAVAATEGIPAQQAANGQFKEQLKQYYDFRNPGKAAEMQALVDKYKKK